MSSGVQFDDSVKAYRLCITKRLGPAIRIACRETLWHRLWLHGVRLTVFGQSKQRVPHGLRAERGSTMSSDRPSIIVANMQGAARACEPFLFAKCGVGLRCKVFDAKKIRVSDGKHEVLDAGTVNAGSRDRHRAREASIETVRYLLRYCGTTSDSGESGGLSCTGVDAERKARD